MLNIVDEINSKILLSEFIGRYVKLTVKGNEKEGLCPFHNEKTPSFSVNDSKGVYYCFGCKESGNLFSFAQKKLNMNFVEVLKVFADQLGIESNYKNKENKFQSYTSVFDLTLKFSLDKVPITITNYLKNRLINKEICDLYQIGFAHDNLYAFIKKETQFNDDFLLKTGVFYSKNQRIFNRFEKRIMFPIKNKFGKIIGFAGRAIDPANNIKYINSAESAVFSKKHIMYGVYEALILKRKNLLIVEGYFDVFSVTANCKDIAAIATMGTAISTEQILIMWDVNHCPIIALDGDEAGQKAMKASLEKILPILKPGYSFKFLILQKNTDPDDILQKGNSINIDKSISLFEYIIEVSMQKYKKKFLDLSPEDKAVVYELIKDYINLIKNKSVKLFYNDLFYKKWRSITKKVSQKFEITTSENLHINILFVLIKEFPVIFYEVQDKLLELDFNLVFSKVRQDMFNFFEINNKRSQLNHMAMKYKMLNEHKKLFNQCIKLTQDIALYKCHLPDEIPGLIKKYNEGVVSKEDIEFIESLWNDVFKVYSRLV